MEKKWTPEQQQVISLRGRNLLVSAAAGSGKTAVLVERIIQMILDRENPVDIDRILVVTFTNKAAAEMRDRIGKAVEEASRKDPGNRHLQMQSALLPGAQISTLHSFALSVIRDHFYEIGIDPAFRTGEDREIELLEQETLEKVLEEAYSAGDEDFLALARMYGKAKDDKEIGEMVRSLFHYAESYPWPEEWLGECLDLYACSSPEEMEKQPWMEELLAYVHSIAGDLIHEEEHLLEEVSREEGLEKYIPVFRSDIVYLEQIAEAGNYERCRKLLQNPDYRKLPRVKDCPEEIKDKIKNVRESMKKQVKNLKTRYFQVPLEDQFGMLEEERPAMRALVKLTRRFMEVFASEKEERQIIDYSDMEHFALRILLDPETREPTAAAKEYRNRFEQVMVDEYQDSNYVQEELLRAVSRHGEGENNLFLVGDVKQSIYRFRLARPELFVSKYNAYTFSESANQRVDLHANFRSRPQVINFVNSLFDHLMDRDIGNIAYDEAAELKAGAVFDDGPAEAAGAADSGDPYRPEILLIRKEKSAEETADLDPEEGEGSCDESGEDKNEIEARAVARRIRELARLEAGKPVFEYRDIAVLLPAVKKVGEVYARVFSEEGIPLVAESSTGYFSAVEVQTLIQFLKVLDNPRQDIPLAGVMRSPIGTFTDDEMAGIRAACPDVPFHEAVLSAGKTEGGKEAGGKPEAGDGVGDRACTDIILYPAEKVRKFLDMIDSFREQVPDTPVHELIQNIFRETGYLDYVTALPGGSRRRANLDKFLELAISYENTGRRGLFDFLRYIEEMQKYEQDYGEAELVSERENAVRLMSIHKSKGLEFRVVFLCGMGHRFNLNEKTDLTLHPSYHAVLAYRNNEKRIKGSFLPCQAVRLSEKRELLGEELRKLYVALTRAEEKIILAGVTEAEFGGDADPIEKGGKLSFGQRMRASCFFDWVLPVIAGADIPCRVAEIGPEQTEDEEERRQESLAVEKKRVLDALAGMQADPEEEERFRAQMERTYPSESGKKPRQKVSVSELKVRQYVRPDPEESEILEKEPEIIPYIPRFAKGEEGENAGALYGTAMHRMLSVIDFSEMDRRIRAGGFDAERFAKEEFERLSAAGRIAEDLQKRISVPKIAEFLRSPAAARMAAADAKNLLYREQPFMMSVSADRVWADAPAGETVLVQGIVDAFWLEGDRLVLLDYKTDAVEDPEELLRRYRVQLELYAEALSRGFEGCSVSEVLIYSFRLRRVIDCREGGKGQENGSLSGQ